MPIKEASIWKAAREETLCDTQKGFEKTFYTTHVTKSTQSFSA